MITVDELREIRGDKCEKCKENQGCERHHIFFRKMKGHTEYDHPYNLMLACSICHTQKKILDGYKMKCWFWQKQVSRYGSEFIKWYEGVPTKARKERYE